MLEVPGTGPESSHEPLFLFWEEPQFSFENANLRPGVAQ